MINNKKETLEQFGLSENEAEIYLIMLETGHSSVLDISKCCCIKRSTIYLIIENLIKKSLVKVVPKGRNKVYLAESPEIIIKMMDDKKRKMEEIMPSLLNMYGEKSEKPNIKFYEGKDGIRSAYKNVFKSKKEILWYGASMEFLNVFPEKENSVLVYAKDNKDFPGYRAILNNIKSVKDKARERNAINNNKIKRKVITGSLFFKNTFNVIYDNKIIIGSVINEFFVVEIESKAVADAYRVMFELAWQTAKFP